ncbi:MAG: hypothetical protein Q4G04_00725 [bacterium]|nr:hypothetical protein [bacterium]
MDMKNKIFILSVGIFSLVLFVATATYSLLVWTTAGVNTSINFEVEGLTINYTNGNNLTATLTPSTAKLADNNIEIEFWNGGSTTLNGSLVLTPTALPEVLKSSALKWELYKSSSVSNSVPTYPSSPIASGNFAELTQGTAATLYTSTLPTTATYYKLYIWLDKSLITYAMNNSTLSVTLSANAVDVRS